MHGRFSSYYIYARIRLCLDKIMNLVFYNYKNWGYPEPNYREGKLWKAYKNLEKPIGTNSLKKHDIAHVRFFPKFLGR